MRAFLCLLALVLFTAGASAQSGGRIVEVRGAPALEDASDRYGEREIARRLSELEDESRDALASRGLLSEAGGALRVTLILEDGKANRPTAHQLSRTPGLSMRSFSRGGASIAAVIRAPDGAIVERMEYAWYTRDITNAARRGVWTDADRTIARFARRLGEQLASPTG